MWSVSPQMETSARENAQSDFKQQRLKAWQPLLTPKWVIGAFFGIAIIFFPIGIAILAASHSVVYFEHRYDEVPCNTRVNTITGQTIQIPPNAFPTTNYFSPTDQNCFVQYDVRVPSDMKRPIFFYYQLTNYYQNHRRYVKSRSDYQLRGDNDPDLSGCDPLTTDQYNRVLYPCGLIANSFFNDTFGAAILDTTDGNQADSASVATVLGNNTAAVNGHDFQPNPYWNKLGISWKTDRYKKFIVNPRYEAAVFNTSEPSPTAVAVDGRYYTNFSPIGRYNIPRIDDEDFIVWMRTAGLPTFKKLYRRIEEIDLKAGQIIRVTINNVYRVSQFSGTKSFVFSTTSWMGGKNKFLGIAYVIVGCICFLLGLIFLIKHLCFPRQLGSMKYFEQKAFKQKSLKF